ncbi:MAG: MotA/TolQ/ExbB proton channel family protein [Lentisphaerae bacterium]|nr:MotA/TolQ/ExbB proton channel family protein [Lentisphaerota bacterium]
MNGITFEQAWNFGGPLMWVLAGISVVELALVLYVLFAQRARAFLRESLNRMRAAKDPEAEGSRIAQKLYSQADWFADIAAIAPLVGLLGTVLGMFQAFGGIATDVTAGAKPVVLAAGVSKAIVTTIFGLVVAIPALVFHAIFRRRAQRLVARLEVAADENQG